MDDELVHEGVARRSGRYPWGSGQDPHQRNRDFLAEVDVLKKKGLSETQIAEGLGINTTILRARKAIAKNEQRESKFVQANMLSQKGLSNVAIGEKMGINESSVRALLDPAAKARNDVLTNTADILKQQVKDKKFLDVGEGTANHMNINRDKLKTAVQMLQEEGYTLDYLRVPQLGTGQFTTIKVLHDGTTPWKELNADPSQVKTITSWSEDGGRSFLGIEKPRSVDSSRIDVKYAEQGGGDADGVMYLRPGVPDISLGQAKYAQVRIAVDDTHYLKGMAVYKDDLPKGIDIQFNTNKSDKGDKLLAMKSLKEDKETGEIDTDNPFGSIVRQKYYMDKDGKRQLSALNIVNEEGKWEEWSSKLSSQALSKQNPSLAKEQLQLTYDIKKTDLDEIMSLTNPAVKKKLLQTFSDEVDSSAVHLKAAGLPRTKTHVILPVNSLKDTEIYAPNYRSGEKVVLIRHPHGGIFEIPELTVNNKNKEANSLIGGAIDAVGINSKVASKLSGADFDGDTVLVIPNNPLPGQRSGKVKTSETLMALRGFDPQAAYPAYEGMPKMSSGGKQQKMGDISNLITDMTIMGANQAEIARAVKHSMVVIDAEKHNLNYRQSYKDNGIAELKTRYQGSARAGAATLISRASSEQRVNERKARSAAEGGAIDAITGKKAYTDTGNSYTIPAHNRVTAKGKVVEVPEKTVYRQIKSTKMAEVDDAFKLSSGTPMEAVYADHANKLKAMANTARKEMLATKSIAMSDSAKEVYKPEVSMLKAKLNDALKNAPLERQAQVFANSILQQKKNANPDMEKDEIKKIKSLALKEARLRTGAKKPEILITPKEWEAIQAGAVSNNFLTQLLNNTDLDKIRKLATPRVATVMNAAKLAQARNLLNAGYDPSEVADALGVSVSTLSSSLRPKG